jgi:RNA polymerase sigma factor (sigma-70 family)
MRINRKRPLSEDLAKRIFQKVSTFSSLAGLEDMKCGFEDSLVLSQCEPEVLMINMDELGPGEKLIGLQSAAYLLAYRITGKVADAEDAVQDAYIRAFKFNGNIPEKTAAQRKWFLRVVANAAKSARSSESMRRNRERSVPLKMPQSMAVADETQSLQDAVADALQSLDENHRLAVSLHYEHGFSYAEAAEIVNKPEVSLRKYASLGLEAIRQKLTRAGFPQRAAEIALMLNPGWIVPPSAALSARITPAVPLKTPPSAAATSIGAAKVSMAGAAILIVTMALSINANNSSETPNASTITIAAASPIVETGDPKDENNSATATADLLSKKLDVEYRRDSLREVLIDLKIRTGLRSVCASHLADSVFVSLTGSQVTLKDVLAKIANHTGVEFKTNGDTTVFYRRSDPKQLARLKQQVNSDDRLQRWDAVCALTLLSDPDIYPPLLEAISDADPVVSDYALKGLQYHLEVISFHIPAPYDSKQMLMAINSSDVERKKDLIRVIGSLRDSQVIRDLCILSKDDPALCRDVADALGAIGGLAVADPLIQLLETSG